MLIRSIRLFVQRTCIVIFWVGCLYLFLNIPKIFDFFTAQRTINLLTWTGTVNPLKIAEFEQKTGIKVNISYFENNEELFVKLYTAGGSGYDIIMPSDYIIPKLAHYNLLKPLDKSKITVWNRIQKRLLNQSFDPKNTYTIPYYWGIYGIGVNRNMISQVPSSSWSLLFEKNDQHAVGMINVAREAILMSAMYLYGTIAPLTEKQVEEIKKLLIKQKNHVIAYIDADVRSNYMLISQSAPIVIATSPYIRKIMGPEHPEIDFIVPAAGSFQLVDNFAVSAASQNDDINYQLINYLYDKEILEYQFLEEAFLPATIELEEFLKKYDVHDSIKKVHLETAAPLYFFEDIIAEDSLNSIWISVKTA